LGKEIVMISEGRHEIPFNIHHNPVTLYRSDSQSGLADLASAITKRLTALLEKKNNGRSTAVVKDNPNLTKKASALPATSKPANTQPKSTSATPRPKQSKAQRREAAIHNALRKNYKPSTLPPAFLSFDKAPTADPDAKKESWWDRFAGHDDGSHYACS